MIHQTEVDKSLNNSFDWGAGDTFRILPPNSHAGKEVIADFLNVHHIHYHDEKGPNSIRIDLVERIARRKKRVGVPLHKPQGRTPKETYRVKEMLSTHWIAPLGSGCGDHKGPYVALWEDEYVVSNPEPQPPRGTLEARQWMTYLPNEYVITRHDEDENEFDILLRTTDKDEALTFFRGLEEEYPQGPVPASRPRPPHSRGQGRHNELGDTKTLSMELPVAFYEEISEQAQRESELQGRKVSRAEALRKRLGLDR